VVIIGASAAVASALIGETVLVLNVRWRRPLLTLSFVGWPEAGPFNLSVRNDGPRTVRDISAQALLDGEPFTGVDLLGSWTLPSDKAITGVFEIPIDALGDPPDLSRLSARVSYPRGRGRTSKDVRCGERGVTLR
jgi:hypothetical protein